MSNSNDLRRAWADEAPYILMYNACVAHDAAHGTKLSQDAGFLTRVAMWNEDGVPWDIRDEAQRHEMFKLMIWEAVKDRLGNARKEGQASAT